MRCTFCGLEFDEARALRGCGACGARARCGGVRCPACGYEAPRELEIVKVLRRWTKRWRENKETGANAAER